jgi:hypothetical protein
MPSPGGGRTVSGQDPNTGCKLTVYICNHKHNSCASVCNRCTCWQTSEDELITVHVWRDVKTWMQQDFTRERPGAPPVHTYTPAQYMFLIYDTWFKPPLGMQPYFRMQKAMIMLKQASNSPDRVLTHWKHHHNFTYIQASRYHVTGWWKHAFACWLLPCKFISDSYIIDCAALHLAI